MQTRLYNPSDQQSWDSYVLHHSDSTHYHLIGWKDVVEKTFGHKTYYLLATQDHVAPETINSSNPSNSINPSNRIVGILPLVQLKSKIFGNFMVSLPFFNYGGICADNEEAREQLLKEAIKIAKGQKMEHIELRHNQDMGSGLPAKMAKVSMRLELPKSAEDLWSTFPSKLRSQIRKPEKEGMYSRFGREEELDSFYTVFSINMRDLGTPVYSKHLFENILKAFPEKTEICTVYTKEGRPVASGFLLNFKTMFEIPWASSLKEFNRSSPNMLLYWSVLKFSCKKGFKVFDFGRSTPGEGTFKFKEQWGAKPVQLYWHYWLNNGGPLPELNPKNPKYQLAIKIWQRLPVGLTKVIGPMIVKNLP